MLVRVCDECGGTDDVLPMPVTFHPTTKVIDLCRPCRAAAELRRLAAEARRERK